MATSTDNEVRQAVSEDMRRAGDEARGAAREIEAEHRTVTLAGIAEKLWLRAAIAPKENSRGVAGLALYFQMLSRTGNNNTFDRLIAAGRCPTQILDSLLS
jgi:hypothetical protein